LDSQLFAPQPPGIDFHLSPYLKVMLAVAKKMGITPTKQPLKKLVQTELDKQWKATGRGKLSETLSGSMATLLREPESSLGKAKPAPKETK
jgi:hypothetical protein